MNQRYSELNHLVERLEIVQTDWSVGRFEEDHIRIELSGSYKLPDDIRTDLLEPQRAEWTEAGFEDNEQIGVHDIKIVRMSDEAIRNIAHEIRIKAHTYCYYESKATHFEWLNGKSRELLNKYAISATHDSHARDLPTPLSVGLSLFCEDGNTLILTRRTASQAAGGHIAAGHIFNAVGENCAPIDTFGELNGNTRLSVFRTGTRGLLEEMGLDLRQVKRPPDLHTLCWNRDMLDYKFFGYVITKLSTEEVRHYWHHSPDKAENRELISHDIHDKKAAIAMIQGMLNNAQEWSYEARTCTIMSLLHIGRLSMTELLAVAG